MRSTLAPLMAASLLLGACQAVDMGRANTNLNDLVRQQQECESKSPSEQGEVLVCNTVSRGLVKLSEDAAIEAEDADDDRNAVFFYRIAAIAAWQSLQPAVLDNAHSYATAGGGLCEGSSNDAIQAGDCQILGMIGALVAHDRAELAYRNVKQDIEAAKAEKSKDSSATLEDLAAAGQAVFLEAADTAGSDGAALTPGETRLGQNARELFDQGWRELGNRWPFLSSNRIDDSLRNYVKAQEKRMVANLKIRHDDLRLSTNPQKRPRHDYDADCEEVKDNQGDEKADDVTLTASAASMGSLADKASRLVWCLWKFADKHQRQ